MSCRQQPFKFDLQELKTTLSFTEDSNEAHFNLVTLQIEATGGPAMALLEKVRR